MKKSKYSDFQSEVSAAIKEIAAKHGLRLDKNAMVHNQIGAVLSLAVSDESNLYGKYPYDAVKCWIQNSWAHGFEDNHIGKVINHGGKDYEIAGMKGNKAVVVRLVGTSTDYLLPISVVQNRLGITVRA